jgi:hypothetical protein
MQSTIRLSAQVVARDARQLAGQLTGHLLSNTSPSIQALLKQATERKNLALAPAFETQSNCTRRSSDPHARRPYEMDPGRGGDARRPPCRLGIVRSKRCGSGTWTTGQTLRTLKGDTGILDAWIRSRRQYACHTA